jgi:hypothetical protein
MGLPNCLAPWSFVPCVLTVCLGVIVCECVWTCYGHVSGCVEVLSLLSGVSHTPFLHNIKESTTVKYQIIFVMALREFAHHLFTLLTGTCLCHVSIESPTMKYQII